MPTPPQNIMGIILAGGKSSRMQFRDKSLMPLAGKPVIEHIIANARSQVGGLLINVNRHPEHYASYGLPIVADTCGQDAGPLAGILAGMEYCHHQGTSQVLACFPGDVPWFPGNIVTQLEELRSQEATQVCYASTNGQWQPLFSVWSVALLPVLRQALANRVFSPMMLIQSLPHSVLVLDNPAPGHFDNLNTPDDLARAEALQNLL